MDTTGLSDTQLGACVAEMRRRGWVVVCYDADVLVDLVAREGVTVADIAAWLKENNDELERAMCVPMYRAIEEKWPNELA